MTEKTNTLQILTAGVAKDIIKSTVEKWNVQHPELQAEMYADGSVDLIRKVQAGERCDVIVIADDTIIKSMMMPQLAEGYIIFAGNRMVLAATGDNDISSENWKEKLLAPETKFAHKNPYADPGGYRGLMALMLAENVETGLAEKLLNHPGHIGMDPKLTLATLPPHDYLFDYYSNAVKRGAKFAQLPDIMDQSNPQLAEEYAKISFAVDANNTVVCTPIAHAVTIPTVAQHKEAAKEFVKMFLQTDFEALSFVKYNTSVGEDILK